MMRFNNAVGNPPYQKNIKGTSAKQIYPQFMDSAYSIGDKAILITPARFLFNVGKTSKAWNRKILDDPFFKVVHYEVNSAKVFDNTDIKGGVAITYRDVNNNTGPIGIFIPHDELSSILNKVEGMSDFEPFDTIMYRAGSYKLSEQLFTDYPNDVEIQKRGVGSVVETNIFDKLSFVFHSGKPTDEYEYIQLFGRINSKERVYRWVKRDYISTPDNFNKWKVFLPKSNGSGAIGEVLNTQLIGHPLIGHPLIGHTGTFLSFGAFEKEEEADACMKYIKSKFARVLLGVLKVTQDNHPRVWAKVPLQDFTEQSDIDWTKTVHEIDQQLYEKYGLNDEEIAFIESKIKPMA